MRAKGADFSAYQSLEVTRELAPKLDFAFVKLTEGIHYSSPVWRDQLRVLHDHGVLVGAYHFGRAVDGARQWDHFEKHLADAPAVHLVAFDYEAAGVTDRIARDFIRRGHQRGYRVGLYGSDVVARKKLGQDWTWSAHWAKTPPPFRFDVWQFAAGAGGKPDWDVFRGDVAQLRAFSERMRRKAKPPKPRWWIHDTAAGRALGPYRLGTLGVRLVAYAIAHPRAHRYAIEFK